MSILTDEAVRASVAEVWIGPQAGAVTSLDSFAGKGAARLGGERMLIFFCVMEQPRRGWDVTMPPEQSQGLARETAGGTTP